MINELPGPSTDTLDPMLEYFLRVPKQHRQDA
jgi:hypothetical protein